MAIVADAFANLLEYLEREEAVLKTLGASDLRACLRTGCGTHGHTADAEREKYYKVLNRIEKNFTAEQRQQIQEWEAKLCVNQTVDPEFSRLLEMLENRNSDLQELGKKCLKDCFFSNKSNKDKDFKFGQNFFLRKAASLTEAQKEELATWEAKICGDSVALRPAVDSEFSHLVEILENRKADLQELGKTSLKDCFFLTNKSNKDKDFKFGRNFFRSTEGPGQPGEKPKIFGFTNSGLRNWFYQFLVSHCGRNCNQFWPIFWFPCQFFTKKRENWENHF